MKLPIRFLFGILLIIILGCTVNEAHRRFDDSSIKIVGEEEKEDIKTTVLENISIPNKTTVNNDSLSSTKPIEETNKTDIWRPSPGTKWDWQLSVKPKIARGDIKVIDIDLFDNSKEDVKALQNKGAKVICYINVGAWEDWREDKNTFSPSVIGNDYDGWEGEKWLDISQSAVIRPIMQKRLNICKEKGFDGVEPDNTDLHLQDTGFDISYQEQLAYSIWLSTEAHKRGLSIGLKNTGDLANQLAEYYDFAILEDCYNDKFCEDFRIFSEYNKAIFAAEYVDNYFELTNEMCDNAEKDKISLILKKRNLDYFIETC